ncbi:stage III sporulation protein AB [Desulfonispora thiosulfatigenes DSM 11270]|uniref:Stage III sporulation protein AB n=1 Tax=Desulfonispora thiosulfatigenes DSM 11270 TaxID=656914 RepID=A0A1W1VN68_DESTI|nr:stage III sporulation protein SpoIIIAB [Desulfonispora thiosulfatigenes]SMB94797.1 stage III sporulation protein AB [Desulfonispora thiosulfatigenes DSM 11270]
MLKILGSIFLIMGFGVIGLVVARNLSLRPLELRQVQNGLKMLETEILYGLTPLPEALSRVSNQISFPINKLFSQSSNYLKNGEGLTAGEAWEISLNELEQESSLLAEDIEILISFGKGLGGSDRDEQTKHLKLVQDHLKNAEFKAEKIKETNQKVYKYLGFSFGAVIALILV